MIIAYEVRNLTLGRFLQTDPIGYADGLNRYDYVGGDPVNRVDPTGTDALCGFGRRAVYNRDNFTGQAQTSSTEIVVLAGYRCEADDDEIFFMASRQQGGAVFGPGQPIVPGSRQTPRNDRCGSPPISSAEAQAARRGDRNSFWNSRAARGDPLGATGRSIVNDSSFGGRVANGRVMLALANRSPGMSAAAIRAETNQIGVELMRAHVNAVRTLVNPSAGDIAQYHFDIFRAHGLPASTFGGSMATGTQAEATMTSPIWRQCR